ncbi:WW domain-containing protein [Madurella fahalii]|uniref:WW domain-containing protein n=1 Tax=Madurella fahalii TaxID=1157608 RepID=A0ABQ0GPA6_9PEZI
MKAFMKVQLPDHRLPLEPADIDKDQGLEFPDIKRAKDMAKMRDVEKEKLELNRNTLAYLAQSLNTGWTEGEQQVFTQSISTYKGVRTRERVAPPLSPMMQTHSEYFVPDGETCDVPEPSDLSSRLSADIEAAETKILEADHAFWADALEHSVSPERYDHIDIPEMIRTGELRPIMPPSTQQMISRDMRLDVPLLTCDDGDGNARMQTTVIAPGYLENAKALVVSSDTPPSSDGPGGQLANFFQESAAAVMRCAEQEKLQPLDAIARVPVPVMDFSVSRPQWEDRVLDVRTMFHWIRENTAVDWKGPRWMYSRAAEQRMVWAPLAHMKVKRLVSERIEIDSSIVSRFLMESQESKAPTSADYVYKNPGVAVFRTADDDDDEDDYLTPLGSLQLEQKGPQPDIWGNAPISPLAESTVLLPNPSLTTTSKMPAPADLATLLSGRRRLIEETIQKKQSIGKRNRELEEPTPISATDIIDPAVIPSTNVLRGFMNEYTDFAPLVDNFVEMNFPKKPKLTHSSFFSPPITTPSFKPNDPTAAAAAAAAANLMPPPPKPIPTLAPAITPPNIPPRVIISSDASKPLTNHLKTLLPGLDLIPRNYTRHRPPAPVLGLRPPNTDDADITISPATGILTTTMVKLRQKPLPGDQAAPATATTTSFCRIAANVAARYERLVVLVSEGNKHSESASPLSQSDARALAEFQGFAAGLREEVRVVYVGGGVETLAKWVAATICGHAGEAVAVRHLLLEVETSWEVFLWRAGMNVFAAQVVLGMLKVPEGMSAIAGGGQLYGLPLFVMMSRERRLALFEEALGGRKVLERVSEALDEPWVGPRSIILNPTTGPVWPLVGCEMDVVTIGRSMSCTHDVL